MAVLEAQIGENRYQKLEQNNLQEALDNQFGKEQFIVQDNKNGSFFINNTDKIFYIKSTGEIIEYNSDMLTVSDVANSNDKASIYGSIIDNYEVNDNKLQSTLEKMGIEWKIFYADDNNIYLIASNYILAENAPKTKNGVSPAYDKENYPYSIYFINVYSEYAGMTDITSDLKKWNNLYCNRYELNTNTNIRSMAYLMDTDIWNIFAGNGAEYAIGSPTLEMWIASWNDMGYTKLYCNNISQNGYYIGISDSPNTLYQYITSEYLSNSGYDNSLYFPNQTNNNNNCYGYWLSSPAAYTEYTSYLMGINESTGAIMYRSVTHTDGLLGFRPIVCLSSDILLKNNQNGTFSIK